jgi:probable phosphoglycerate mutase
MKLLVTRHGETEWNRKNMILGRTDITLNETGIMQAKKLRDNIPYPIKYVIASPLQRAAMTANIVCENLNVEIKYDDRLMEMDFGTFEGRDRTCEVYQKEKRNFFTRYPQGESYFQVAQRVYNCLDEIIEKYSDGNVLIITHNGICRVIRTYFDNISNEEFAQYSLKNCELEVYHI